VRRELARLEVEVALCDRCYGAENRYPVRFERPGVRPRILVLGERPPRATLEAGLRLGLENPDPGTRFLREMLDVAGLDGDETLIASSILCRPVSRVVERAVPGTACLRECAVHVRELVRIVRPRLVLPLGATALRSLRAAFPSETAVQGLRFPGSVGGAVRAGDVWIHPLYHTTTRARVSRPAERQRRDWREVGRLVRWIAAGEGGPPPRCVEIDRTGDRPRTAAPSPPRGHPARPSA
jgi:uracil-DNA glycosylase family 4